MGAPFESYLLGKLMEEGDGCIVWVWEFNININGEGSKNPMREGGSELQVELYYCSLTFKQ